MAIPNGMCQFIIVDRWQFALKETSHILPVSSAQVHALWSPWTSVRKHKLKNKMIKNFRMVTMEHKASVGSFWAWAHCSRSWSCPGELWSSDGPSESGLGFKSPHWQLIALCQTLRGAQLRADQGHTVTVSCQPVPIPGSWGMDVGLGRGDGPYHTGSAHQGPGWPDAEKQLCPLWPRLFFLIFYFFLFVLDFVIWPRLIRGYQGLTLWPHGFKIFIPLVFHTFS